MFRYSKKPSQNKKFVCKHHTVSHSLSFSLSHTHSLALSLLLRPADRPTCLIRGKQVYQELLSSPTLRPMITEHFRQVPSFRCMPWADPEGRQGVRIPPPLKNHKNIGFPSNIDPANKPAFNGGPLTRQQNAISEAFR